MSGFHPGTTHQAVSGVRDGEASGPTPIRLLACGGRDYADRKTLNRCLSALGPVSLLITGGATGADRLAELWAQHNKVPLCVFPANWRFEGAAAGPLRNARMLEFAKPDMIAAFPGGRGTADMVRRAEAAGVMIARPVLRPADTSERSDPLREDH